ncbi:hypothetical protein RJ640_006409 [Escallonia rubra]|uniref:SH2 domain-containing protein n=1 Tax=Escallonia rubra TaxID=112253 RepID=A0AA88RQP4_9ASTE|nr:hypothetical protein RJ640_006409 [Escallonia rubra]
MGDKDGYSLLKDLKLEIKNQDGSFCVCFWLYLTKSIQFPSILIRQVHPDITSSIPFLALNEKKEMMLFPLIFMHQEAPSPTNSASWTDVPCALAKMEVPLKKWVHVGCEVSVDVLRLHLDGEIMGEKPISCLLDDLHSDDLRKVSLAGSDGDICGTKCYVHSAVVLPLTSSINDYRVQDPPLQLYVDGSSAFNIEEGSDGVWSIVGGKASCRKRFSLDVILLDAFGQTVKEEMEVVASLLYADNEAPVEKPHDAEAPLLMSYDGIEYASWDRPSKLVNGRASFKLKISQLSSKCDNRLFCIRFHILKVGRYPFFEALSSPIHCVSRNCTTQTSPFIWKKSTSAVNGSQYSALDEESSKLLQNIVSEAKPSPSSKRIKLGQENPFVMFKADTLLERANQKCNSPARATHEDDNACGTRLERRPENHEDTDNSSFDSERSEATNSFMKSKTSSPVSDMTVFKYCLGGLKERSLLLKEIAMSASENELVDFAQQVSLYSGCLHHRHQIVLAKGLIKEGIRAWNMVSQNNHHVLWENLDFELLRRIAGCQELVAQENFEKLWCWLYPVAFTLSQDWINSMWDSASSKWIEGLITKEEAEASLQGPGGLQDPGTFILRFPTSRSWPHPDAGNLIVTYVGSDYAIHHRLLSVEFYYSAGAEEKTVKPLHDMILEEPELSRLGRVIRSH